MKFLLLFLFVIAFSFRPTEKKSINSFDYYFTLSKYNFNNKEKFYKWNSENKDTAIYTFGYFRGDCCGGVPNPNIMKAKILNDTIFYNDGRTTIENCDSRIGLCGSVIDFVINKRKYPNYKKLKWKVIDK